MSVQVDSSTRLASLSVIMISLPGCEDEISGDVLTGGTIE